MPSRGPPTAARGARGPRPAEGRLRPAGRCARAGPGLLSCPRPATIRAGWAAGRSGASAEPVGNAHLASRAEQQRVRSPQRPQTRDVPPARPQARGLLRRERARPAPAHARAPGLLPSRAFAAAAAAEAKRAGPGRGNRGRSLLRAGVGRRRGRGREPEAGSRAPRGLQRPPWADTPIAPCGLLLRTAGQARRLLHARTRISGEQSTTPKASQLQGHSAGSKPPPGCRVPL